MYHTSGRSTQINEICVGFEDEAKIIIDKLERGHTSLDIVSVVGMVGLGKTTLAKKVYDSLSRKRNFDVFAFACVSQDDNTRRLLLDILCDIGRVDDEIHEMTEDDLAHKLWKSLSGQKYLIVLDDIWNASAWEKIKSSFPNDNNGSRVMITTRYHDVADKCRIDCSPHLLRFMSEVESWELLQKKVFPDGISPPYLNEIGKLIAKNCKGLPLAVALIAGLLSRTEESLRSWAGVSESVASYLSDEGVMKSMEIGFEHLPENPKPCLLDEREEPIETLDIHRELESLTLTRLDGKIQYLTSFPSTLQKLTIDGLDLPSTVISSIAELHFLEVLKLREISFPEPRLEMEDLVFRNLKIFHLRYRYLEEWNASAESLPCLEHLVISSGKLQELPVCLREITTLRRISVDDSPQLASSALRIQEELKELGIEVSVSINTDDST